MHRNVSLVYKLLRFINSPLFAWHSHIKSIRHAMTLLGGEELRKWICLLLVAGLGSEAVPQLLVESLVRARFAELLCPKIRLGHKKASAFLLGLLSHLDALLHRPIYLRFERNLTASSDAPLFRSVETRLLTTGWACLFGSPNKSGGPPCS